MRPAIELNGERREVAAGTTLADLVRDLGLDPSGRGVAVAVGGEVVPRAQWAACEVSEGDRVEVLGARQGG